MAETGRSQKKKGRQKEQLTLITAQRIRIPWRSNVCGNSGNCRKREQRGCVRWCVCVCVCMCGGAIEANVGLERTENKRALTLTCKCTNKSHAGVREGPQKAVGRGEDEGVEGDARTSRVANVQRLWGKGRRGDTLPGAAMTRSKRVCIRHQACAVRALLTTSLLSPAVGLLARDRQLRAGRRRFSKLPKPTGHAVQPAPRKTHAIDRPRETGQNVCVCVCVWCWRHCLTVRTASHLSEALRGKDHPPEQKCWGSRLRSTRCLRCCVGRGRVVVAMLVLCFFFVFFLLLPLLFAALLAVCSPTSMFFVFSCCCCCRCWPGVQRLSQIVFFLS